MNGKNIAGLIYSNSYDNNLPELTNLRTMGSVPFGGRYRLIDFMLSNMVNTGISKVGVLTKNNICKRFRKKSGAKICAQEGGI